MRDDDKLPFSRIQATEVRPFLITTLLLLALFVFLVRYFGWQR